MYVYIFVPPSSPRAAMRRVRASFLRSVHPVPGARCISECCPPWLCVRQRCVLSILRHYFLNYRLRQLVVFARARTTIFEMLKWRTHNAKHFALNLNELCAITFKHFHLEHPWYIASKLNSLNSGLFIIIHVILFFKYLWWFTNQLNSIKNFNALQQSSK